MTYSYDAAGNLLGAAMPGAGITYSYDPRNLPTAASRTNGVATTRSYDPLGRVLAIIHAVGPTAINTQTYSYDQAGNLNAASNDISQPLSTQTAASTADQANELLTNAQTTYTYDANGNRLTETSATGTLTYQWDSRNRLSSITDSSGNITAMHYDFSRNLLELDHTTGNSTTSKKFVVDSVTNVVALTDPSGLPVSVLTGRSLDSYYASTDSFGNALFGIGDTLGSTTGVTNAAGAITTKLAYEPYGQTTGSVPSTYLFGYTGRLPVVGNVYYYRNRFYDAGAGKFLSEDPLGLNGGDSNLYRYATNDPVYGTDPTGLDATKGQPSCVSLFFEKTLEHAEDFFVPYQVSGDVGPDEFIKPGLDTYAIVRYNQALNYAANRGLTSPFKSSIFRAILGSSQEAAELGESVEALAAGAGAAELLVPALAVWGIFSAAEGAWDTYQAGRQGECQ